MWSSQLAEGRFQRKHMTPLTYIIDLKYKVKVVHLYRALQGDTDDFKVNSSLDFDIEVRVTLSESIERLQTQ